MSTNEYNALINRLIAGLPPSVVITRLNLVLWSVVSGGGPTAMRALRDAVAGYRRRDAGAEEERDAPVPPAPRRP
jgi:hypothetical protein